MNCLYNLLYLLYSLFVKNKKYGQEKKSNIRNTSHLLKVVKKIQNLSTQ